MLEAVKTALRISHNALDDEILENIEAAKRELIRSGVDAGLVAECEDPLIVRAVKTYCLSVYVDDLTKAEKYMDSFKYQQDNLRKSVDYVG